MPASMHTNTRMHTHAHAHTHTHIHKQTHTRSLTHTHAYMQAEKATKETIAFMIKYTSAQIQKSQLYSGFV
jgi:hypothetical protein